MERIRLTKREKRVLRILNQQDFTTLTEFDTASLHSLSTHGLVHAAYIEGGGIEDAKLTTKGKELLRDNPHLYNPVMHCLANAFKALKKCTTIKLFSYKIPKKGITMTKEELQTHLDALCKQNGFDYAKYLGKYKGEDIYQPRFSTDEDVLFGRPCFLHVKGNKIRRSKNYKEASKVLHFFYD